MGTARGQSSVDLTGFLQTTSQPGGFPGFVVPLPPCRRQDAGSPANCQNAGMPKPDLDDLDRRLIAELSADARLTQVALAARVGLSRSAVQERLKRLERDGVILGYTLRLGLDSAPGVRAYLLVRGAQACGWLN